MDSSDPNRFFFGAETPPRPLPILEASEDGPGVGIDGTVDRLIKKRSSAGDQRPSMAVFIHAGAGYHSLQNENVHLTMCAKAAQAAMKCLKNGGSATEAVEAAIVVLENNDITNAGYGSNLSADGNVECDATIVDHFGRSGACGAVPCIPNPISLAKLILDTSLRPLTLRRVPPNILVGKGATKFGLEHGMSLVKNRALISRNAYQRYIKWCEDLRKAQARLTEQSGQTQAETAPPEEAKYSSVPVPAIEPAVQAEALSGLQSLTNTKAGQALTARNHSSALLTGMWNEGQPDSPCDSASPGTPASDPSTPTKPLALAAALQNGIRTPTRSPRGLNVTRPIDATDGPVRESRSKRLKTSSEDHVTTANGAGDLSDDSWDWANRSIAEKLFSQPSSEIDLTELTAEPDNADSDKITDTIGAIVIDGQGNMAAGSSSGGIGMKHMGRVGPAALVGVGTFVIPRDPDDDEARCVATVTSGTGEHMATTMAAHKCADRLYHMTKAGPGGNNTDDVPDEGTIMADFVTRDFMGHPGVRNQTSAGAIGVLAVKATSSGIYMHWAHNTDSFALAHMASYHKEPQCVMSRLGPGNGPVNIGAQKVLRDYAAGSKSRG
ncbi:threonine aspartase [Diaporthe helianthi]|uniref:Threonine aspartase n=1 Tax=Diaporthe helianthi TaxID=158607 RepID=A0A2P5I155_DIAHE|nr:threonine aspartase [Diaporthe helianthi]